MAEAREWLKHNISIPHEEVIAELGLYMADSSAWAKLRFLQSRADQAIDSGQEQWLKRSLGLIRPKLTFAAWTGRQRSSFLHRLARFLATEEGDVKRLADSDPPELRLRLGDYRVRFYDHGDWIEILRIRNRKDAYR